MAQMKAKTSVRTMGKFCLSVPLALFLILPISAYSDSELPVGVDPRPSEPDLEQLLSILRTTPEKGWVRVNNNEFQDVWTPTGLLVSVDKEPDSTPWDPRMIIAAHSSFAWDSRRGDLILYGGGHASYGGNDVYRWRATTLDWERMSLPSDITSLGSFPWFTVDGPLTTPQSAHTYDNNIYLPIADRFLTFGGATYNLGIAYIIPDPEGTWTPLNTEGGPFRVTGPYFFDPSRADDYKVGGTTGTHSQWDNLYLGVIGGEMWENRDIPESLPSAFFPQHFIEGSTGYTQENGKDVVFVHGGYTRLFKYTINDVDDPTQDDWEHIGEGGGISQAVGAYLPTLDLYLRISPNRFSYWDLSTASPTNPNVTFIPSGNWPPSVGVYGLGDYGLDYDAPRDRLLLWGGGGNVWALNPPPAVSPVGWEIEKIESTSTQNPDNGPGTTGVLGKWKYIAQLDAFIALQDRFAGNIWIYKPENWTEPTSDDPHITIVEPTSKGFIIPNDDIVVTAVTANAESNLTQVELLLDGQTLTVLTEPPYTTTVTSVTEGVYTFEAIATDENGNTFISPRVSATVANHVNNPPLVSMSAPLDGSIYVEGRTITLSADASDSDGSIVQVEFFLNGNSLGVDTTAPYSMNWVEAHEGSHMLTAAATDDTGITAVSPATAVNVTPPGDLIVLQDGLSGYSGTTDTFLDSTLTTLPMGSMEQLQSIKDVFNPLVRFAIFSGEGGPVPEGATITYAALALYKFSYYDHIYRAHPLLTDWVENEATWIEAADGIPWNEPGAAGIGSDYAANGSLEVSADWNPGWVMLDVTDSVQSMSQGEQSNNGWQLIAVSGYPAQKSFRASEYPADPTLRPKLILQYDENSNSRPTVALTAPNEGASYIHSDTITLSADADDPDGSVTQVDFFYNNLWLGVDTTAPYTLNWSGAPAGTHSLTAVATDDDYASATSAAVTISKTPPPGC
jgi:hypothetical protein